MLKAFLAWLARTSLVGQIAISLVAGGLLAWHRHEMPFGFGLAIIAGFLLTAVQTWTGQTAPSGNRLMGLAVIWLAARLGWLFNLPLPLLLPLEAAFLFAVAALLLLRWWHSRKTAQ